MKDSSVARKQNRNDLLPLPCQHLSSVITKPPLLPVPGSGAGRRGRAGPGLCEGHPAGRRCALDKAPAPRGDGPAPSPGDMDTRLIPRLLWVQKQKPRPGTQEGLIKGWMALA